MSERNYPYQIRLRNGEILRFPSLKEVRGYLSTMTPEGIVGQVHKLSFDGPCGDRIRMIPVSPNPRELRFVVTTFDGDTYADIARSPT